MMSWVSDCLRIVQGSEQGEVSNNIDALEFNIVIAVVHYISLLIFIYGTGNRTNTIIK